MRKLTISLACALGILSSANAAQESGFFIGGNIGVPITSVSYGGFFKANSVSVATLSNTLESILPTTGYGWGLGVDLGYKQALSDSMGLKYYVNYMYNYNYGDSDKTASASMASMLSMGNVHAEIEQYLITFNVDYYYNPIDLVGVYIGLGVGYQGYTPTWNLDVTGMMASMVDASSLNLGRRGGFALPLNLGVTLNPTDRSQITIGAKIPLIQYKYKIASTEGMGAIFGQSGEVKLATYAVQVGYNYTF